jgi:hypothetical protein
MQKRKQRRKRQISVSPPVVVSPDVLPLLDSQVTWNGFEKFIRQLIGLLPRVRQVKRYGKLGSKQKGIDLIAIMENDERWVFQCKQYSSFKLKDAEESVAKATYQADKYFLIIACQADSTVHDFIEKQKKWELWDGERLSDEILKLPRDKARELVIRHFGPDWSKTFLGLGSTSPFLPWKLFFQRWSRPDRLFNHTWHLVGRSNYISVLGGFCSDKHKRVALLIGRGGIGKSKLLHALRPPRFLA